MTNSAIQSMKSIDRFLREVAVTEKRAAEAHTEPGSVGGSTTHPVKDVDDSTEEATEGSRSAENTADIKADQGKPSVDSTPENVANKKAVDGKSEGGSINPPGTASQDQLQIGTKKEPTGEDPAVETSSAKAEKEDSTGGRLGNTTHPARTNNGELDGYKYAEMPIDQLAKVAADLGNNLLAALANGYSKPATVKKGLYAKAPDEEDEEDEDCDKMATDLAGQAGWELAGLLNGSFDKKAADSMVQHTLEEIIKTASDDAEKVADFLANFSDELTKLAEGEMPAGIDPAALMGGDPSAMGGDPSAMGGDPSAMGGEPDGGESAEMAGAMTGGDPSGQGDGDVEQLAAVLAQLGISPEELEAAMAGGGGQGEDPGSQPDPSQEDDAASDSPGMETEASDRGRSKKAAVKKVSADKSVRDYIQEVLERSRR